MADQRKSVNYYKLLGVRYSASPQDIRRAYREMSKLYHPDTTELPPAIATEKFQLLNEAYGTLSSPEKRRAYDLEQGYSRVAVIQPTADLRQATRNPARSSRSSAYLDPSDRPLSPGEIFALFILGLTFVACLVLVITIGVTRGEFAVQNLNPLQIKPSEAVEIFGEDLAAPLPAPLPAERSPESAPMPPDSAVPRFPEPTQDTSVQDTPPTAPAGISPDVPTVEKSPAAKSDPPGEPIAPVSSSPEPDLDHPSDV
jgi:hypothetical protein